jgi:hypothetical protein
MIIPYSTQRAHSSSGFPNLWTYRAHSTLAVTTSIMSDRLNDPNDCRIYKTLPTLLIYGRVINPLVQDQPNHLHLINSCTTSSKGTLPDCHGNRFPTFIPLQLTTTLHMTLPASTRPAMPRTAANSHESDTPTVTFGNPPCQRPGSPNVYSVLRSAILSRSPCQSFIRMYLSVPLPTTNKHNLTSRFTLTTI